MKRFLSVLLMVALGCSGEIIVQSQPTKKAATVAQSKFSIEVVSGTRKEAEKYIGSPMYLLEVKNRGTGKTHLVAFYRESEYQHSSVTMIKLEEY